MKDEKFHYGIDSRRADKNGSRGLDGQVWRTMHVCALHPKPRLDTSSLMSIETDRGALTMSSHAIIILNDYIAVYFSEQFMHTNVQSGF